MNIKFLSENKVQVTLSVGVVHARPARERKTYKTPHAVAALLKQYPDLTVKNVVESSIVKNWFEGCGNGEWIFEVENKVKTKQTTKQASTMFVPKAKVENKTKTIKPKKK